ncbi:recombinase family protein [Streptomyces sioyaensis]|uniref:recombinase family protein n=1 Tax=Streptomyces sioyaensis TaxID=67364 RepID=UPI003669E8C4
MGKLKPRRVGIYVRISKDRKGQELGIQRQEKACRELCERMGWGIHKVYPENDTSASTTSRKTRTVYAGMLRDARDGVIDGIVVYSIDRLTRRITELTTFLEEQKEHGFAFATTEGEDTSTANGRMILTIKGAVAQQETERMSERVNNSLLQRREKGKPHAGGSRLFGFKEGSNFQELEPGETELIKLGYQMLLDQRTPGDVARAWNERGARTPEAGTVWDIHKVKRVYRSERIGGVVTYKGQDIGDSVYPTPSQGRSGRTFKPFSTAGPHLPGRVRGSASTCTQASSSAATANRPCGFSGRPSKVGLSAARSATRPKSALTAREAAARSTVATTGSKRG